MTASTSSSTNDLSFGSAVVLFALFFLMVVVDQSEAQGFDPKPEDYLQWVANITDPNIPLPGCEEVGVFEALTCQALCEAINGGDVVFEDTRDVNGDFTCACETQEACSDLPTCGQLTMKPGQVQGACEALCNGRFTAVVDEVEFAGAITAANKDMTHFVMECRCDGDIECSDYILFSDIAQPTTCASLQITDQPSCDSYCETEGGGLFDLKGNFTLLDDASEGYCECLATSATNVTEVDAAPACSDEAVVEGTVACTLQEGVGCNNPKPDGGGGGGLSGTCALLTGVTGIVAAVSLSVIALL